MYFYELALFSLLSVLQLIFVGFHVVSQLGATFHFLRDVAFRSVVEQSRESLFPLHSWTL